MIINLGKKTNEHDHAASIVSESGHYSPTMSMRDRLCCCTKNFLEEVVLELNVMFNKRFMCCNKKAVDNGYKKIKFKHSDGMMCCYLCFCLDDCGNIVKVEFKYNMNGQRGIHCLSMEDCIRFCCCPGPAAAAHCLKSCLERFGNKTNEPCENVKAG